MPTVFRYDSSVQTIQGSAPAGGEPQLLAIAGATVAVYTDTAGTILATTYTDFTGSTTCPNSAQLTLPGTSLPTSTAGAQGQFGFWITAGTYYYRVTSPGGQAFGPFPLTAGIPGSGSIPAATGPLQYLRTQPNTGNNSTLQFAALPTFNAGDYAFTIQPGGSLSSGSNTVTVAVMPAGLSVGNSLYVSGGTGAAEAVAITSLGVSTISFSCANTHSGAWTIQSASGGIQEAVIATGGTGGVLIPAGITTLRAPVLIPGSSTVSLRGFGQGISILQTNGGLSGDWIYFKTGSAAYVDCGGFSIVDQNGTMHTSGSMIRVGGRSLGLINNIEIENGYDGLVMDTCPGTVTVDSVHAGVQRHAIYVTTFGVNYPTVAGSGGRFSNCSLANISDACLQMEGPMTTITFVNITTGTVPLTSNTYGLQYVIDATNPSGETSFTNCIFDASGNAVRIVGPNSAVYNENWLIFEGCEMNGYDIGFNILGAVQNVYVNGGLIKSSGGTGDPVSVTALVTGVPKNIQLRDFSAYGTGTQAFLVGSATAVAISNVAVGYEGSGPTTFMTVQNTVSAAVENCDMTNCSTAKIVATGGASLANIRVTDFSNAFAFADLLAFKNGSIIMCSNGTIANPVASGGSGCLAKRLNGVWVGN